jgi:hypothetical protein
MLVELRTGERVTTTLGHEGFPAASLKALPIPDSRNRTEACLISRSSFLAFPLASTAPSMPCLIRR